MTKTKSDATKREYLDTFHRIKQRVSIFDMPRYLASKAPDYRPNSFYKIRASLEFGLKQLSASIPDKARRRGLPENHPEVARLRQKIGLVIEELKKTKGTRCKRVRDYGNSCRLKSISQADFETLRVAIEARKSDDALLAADWLVVTCLVGLRPCEWRQVVSAQFNAEGNIYWLRVRNAKRSNGRTHGETRDIGLDMSSLCLENIQRLSRFIRLVRRMDHETFKRKHRNSARLISSTYRMLWPRRKKFAQLYTGRHVFASTMKRSCGSRIAAAVMGHKHNQTCQSQYGSVRAKTVGLAPVKANEEDVKRVEFRESQFIKNIVHKSMNEKVVGQGQQKNGDVSCMPSYAFKMMP